MEAAHSARRAGSERRIVNALSLSAEERYLDFLKNVLSYCAPGASADARFVPRRVASKRSAESASISRKRDWRAHFTRRLQVTRLRPGQEVRREGDSKH